MQRFSAIPNMFPRAPCLKQGQSTQPCMQLPKKISPWHSPSCLLGKTPVPGRKRPSASIKLLSKLFQAGLEKCYQWHKLSLLKFATFWQYRAGKHRIILGTAYTYSLSSGPIFLHLIANRCWHFTACRANPLFFTPP